MSSPEPRPRPKIVTSLRRSPGRYRRKTEPDATPVAPAGSLVRMDVGDGVRDEDLGRLLAFARQIRGARKLEILGRSPKAVAGAEAAFLAAWQADDDVAAGVPSATPWAALMLAQADQSDDGSPQ